MSPSASPSASPANSPNPGASVASFYDLKADAKKGTFDFEVGTLGRVDCAADEDRVAHADISLSRAPSPPREHHSAPVPSQQLKGKVTLIVNTASKCGFTPQYTGLEKLHQQFKDQGLVVLGFPCNQFGGQEPGSEDEIESFCQINHGVTFPLMKKSDVNGEHTSEVYQYVLVRESRAGQGSWGVA